jgi:hypothetical protein
MQADAMQANAMQGDLMQGGAMQADAVPGGAVQADPMQADAGAALQADAGAMLQADAGAMLQPDCESGDLGPCGSFNLSLSGTTLELGPLGASMDVNVGTGFAASVSPSDTEASCARIAASFGEPEGSSDSLLDTTAVDLSLYTVYRPAIVGEDDRFPLIVWGNGTCAKPEGYGALLRYVASHGYVIVAPNSRFTAYGAPMTLALDFMFAANDDESSPYYQLLDLENVGAMGHSQGAGATATVASDPRVDSVILWNGRGAPSKPYMAVTGESDIGDPTVASVSRTVEGSSADKAAWLYYTDVPQTGSVSGHLTLMTQPDRVVEPATKWWDMVLKGDQAARDWLVNDMCTTCGAHQFGSKGL